VKVATVKSNWFLFRKNSWVCYAALIFASLINWDAVIAAYNLNLAYGKNVKPDTKYLSQLSYTAIPILLDYYQLEQQGKTKAKFFDKYMECMISANSKELKDWASQKDWQSNCLIKIEGANKISSMKNNTLNDYRISSIYVAKR
jgi:hypothetical protein